MAMNKHCGLLCAAATTALMLLTFPGAALAKSGSVVIPLDQMQVVPVTAEEMHQLRATPQGEAFLGSGAYTSDVVGPSLYVAGWWYKVTFPSNVTVPTGSTIRDVYWTWGVYNYRSDLLVWLVHASGYYLDISYMGSGGTQAFTGFSANQTFQMWFGVPGNFALNPPMSGQMDSLIVNYSTP